MVKAAWSGIYGISVAAASGCESTPVQSARRRSRAFRNNCQCAALRNGQCFIRRGRSCRNGLPKCDPHTYRVTIAHTRPEAEMMTLASCSFNPNS